MESIWDCDSLPSGIIDPADNVKTETKEETYWDRFKIFNVHKLEIFTPDSPDLRHVPGKFFFATDMGINYVRRKHMDTLLIYDPMPEEFRENLQHYFPDFKIEQYFQRTTLVRAEPMSHVTSFLYANLFSMELYSFADESKIKAYLPALISGVAQDGHYGALRRYGDKLALHPMSIYACNKYHRKGVIFECCRRKSCCHMA